MVGEEGKGKMLKKKCSKNVQTKCYLHNSDLRVNLSEVEIDIAEDTSMTNLKVPLSELSPCCLENNFPTGDTTATMMS